MKKIGLLGGMSWESSALYYRLINEEVRNRLGGLHSARCVLGSVDFAEVERMQVCGEWHAAGQLLAAEARALKRAGADFLVLCTNTMHKVADRIEAAVEIPLLHLVDATADAVRRESMTSVGLLGTRFTMEEPFYRDRMAGHGIVTIVPPAADREIVNAVIYDELVRGVVDEDSRREYRRVIAGLVKRGAAGIVLGCTEIELLVGPDDSPVPVFASTALHARAAVDRALG